VFDGDAQGGELGLEAAASVAELGGEDVSVGEQGGGKTSGGAALVEGGDDICGGGHPDHDGGDDHAGVVVDEVEDLYFRSFLGSVVEDPVGHAGMTSRTKWSKTDIRCSDDHAKMNSVTPCEPKRAMSSFATAASAQASTTAEHTSNERRRVVG
jgi:hypothetical protein